MRVYSKETGLKYTLLSKRLVKDGKNHSMIGLLVMGGGNPESFWAPMTLFDIQREHPSDKSLEELMVTHDIILEPSPTKNDSPKTIVMEFQAYPLPTSPLLEKVVKDRANQLKRITEHPVIQFSEHSPIEDALANSLRYFMQPVLGQEVDQDVCIDTTLNDNTVPLKEPYVIPEDMKHEMEAHVKMTEESKKKKVVKKAKDQFVTVLRIISQANVCQSFEYEIKASHILEDYEDVDSIIEELRPKNGNVDEARELLEKVANSKSSFEFNTETYVLRRNIMERISNNSNDEWTGSNSIFVKIDGKSYAVIMFGYGYCAQDVIFNLTTLWDKYIK